MSKHTPGPWGYEVSYDHDAKEDRLNLLGQGQILLQHISFIGDNAVGNFHLIAAAPELLETLRRMRARYCHCPDDSGSCDACVECDSVILKAGGSR